MKNLIHGSNEVILAILLFTATTVVVLTQQGKTLSVLDNGKGWDG